ncbi:MAG: hypothetical protein ABJG78_00030 [Cyclobacteriaceae bacterium]
MKAVKVQYTVKPEYVETNKANIKKVMDTLKASPIAGMQYASFALDDGQTFVHINMAKDQETMNKLQEVEEFNEFRMQLKASGPVSPPQSENLNLVSSGFELS